MLYPICSDKLDYEAELAVVIGRTARNVSIAMLIGARPRRLRRT
ncbi:fumarylacetoacetate hydrolase family protein [Sphingomonas sp.]